MRAWRPPIVCALGVALSIIFATTEVPAGSQRGGQPAGVIAAPGNDWFCIQGIGRPRSGAGNESPLNETAALRVTIDDPDKLLGPDTLDKTAGHFMRALSVWRRVCPACDAGSLIHIAVNGRSYLNAVAFDAIRTATPDTRWVAGRPVFDTPVASKEAITLSFVQTRMRAAFTPRGVPPAPMVPVTRGDAFYKHLCSLPEKGLPQFVTQLQRDLYCATGGRDDGAETGRPLRIILRNRHTSCGFSKNIIACEADPYLLEFNGRDYTFTDGTAGGRMFGNGTTKVGLDHVLVHELGHWVGLPHVSSPESVMAEALENSKCVDAATINALGGVTAKPWTPTTKAALKFTQK